MAKCYKVTWQGRQLSASEYVSAIKGYLLSKTSASAIELDRAILSILESKSNGVSGNIDRLCLESEFFAGKPYRVFPIKWITLSARQTRDELIRRGWTMRGAWAERSIGTTRIVLSGKQQDGDKRFVAISFHPRFSAMSESVALSLIESELAREKSKRSSQSSGILNCQVVDSDKPPLGLSLSGIRKTSGRPEIASFSRCPYAVLHEQNRISMTSDWTDAIVITLSKSRAFGVFARKNYEVMDTGASRKWVTLGRWVGLKTELDIYKAIMQAESILDVTVDWDVVYRNLTTLAPNMATKLQKLSPGFQEPDE